jgi:hypothetical protein
VAPRPLPDWSGSGGGGLGTAGAGHLGDAGAGGCARPPRAGGLGGRLRCRRPHGRPAGDRRHPLPGRLAVQAGDRLGRAPAGRAGPDRPGRADRRPAATLAPPAVTLRRRRGDRASAAQPHRRAVGARLRRPGPGPAAVIHRGLAGGADGRQLPGRAAGGARPALAVLGWRLQPAAAAGRGAHLRRAGRRRPGDHGAGPGPLPGGRAGRAAWRAAGTGCSARPGCGWR